MDESGNKQDDRFFVCGFLEVESPFKFNQSLHRVRDQIFNVVQKQRGQRAQTLYAEGNVDELYTLSKRQAFFELKFKSITLHTIGLYKDLIKAMNAKCAFSFKAIVIDRQDPHYVHESLEGMYKRIAHLYFDHCQLEPCIFVPDHHDPNFDWQTLIARPEKVVAVLPATSHEFLPLQAVDLLTGIIRLGLEIQSGEKQTLGRNDQTRSELVRLFEDAFQIKIAPVSNSSKSGNYLGIWTIDFSKSKKVKA